MDRYQDMPEGWHPPMARPSEDLYDANLRPISGPKTLQGLLDMLLGTESIGLDPQESWPPSQISPQELQQMESVAPPKDPFKGLGKLLKGNFKKRNKKQHDLYDQSDKKEAGRFDAEIAEKERNLVKEKEELEIKRRAEENKIKETDFTQNTQKDKDYQQKRMESMEERFDPDKTGMTSADWLDSDETIDEITAKSWLSASGISLEEFKADNPDWDGTGRQVLEYLGF